MIINSNAYEIDDETAVVIGLFLIAASAQSQPVLVGYIKKGLTNNVVLKDKKVSLQKSMVALKKAKSLFEPTTWFEGTYNVAKGGRTIDIPVGDLVNPVYQTLNQLTGSSNFKSISNTSEQLLPDNFYDVRINTTMPIINTDIKYNRTIKEQQTQLQQNEIEQYKRELVLHIKVAYYNYLMATKAIIIYQNALQVVNQNLRTNQSLLANGKGLYAYVSRSQSEVQTVESQLQDAQNQQKNAQAYFNFLLNKELTNSIATNKETPSPTLAQIPASQDVTQREELKGLNIAREINGQAIKMNKAFATPRLNAFLDFASQARDFRVDSKSFFYFGGVQLQIPIYTGKRNL